MGAVLFLLVLLVYSFKLATQVLLSGVKCCLKNRNKKPAFKETKRKAAQRP